jgi:GrpB-like predicted nucleotidyltransferase (UPF0157 family)
MSVSETHPITIVAYNPQWPLLFAELRQVLEAGLGTLALSIEHVGSTAVPGLAAKPIVDLDIVIASSDCLSDAIRALALLGYVHEGDLGVAGREVFARQGQDVPWDGTGRPWPQHHLYVCARDSAELARHVAFRDYLRQHSEVAAAYVQLKGQLAQQFSHDREAYTQGKRGFIEAILRRAKA